jgi:hypothetical protein
MNEVELKKYLDKSVEFIIDDCNLPINKHFSLLQDLNTSNCNLKLICNKHNILYETKETETY